MKTSNMEFVCVHLGAGYHSSKKNEVYKELCVNACEKGLKVLREAQDSVAAVTATVSILEDSPLTNAGIGSNLTIDGTVECDAGLMEASSLKFAGIGAASGIQNPIQVAKSVIDAQRKKPKPAGKRSPSLLVGSGVNRWAALHGMAEVHPSQLVTQEALKERKKSLKIIGEVTEETKGVSMKPLDTVGAICIDSMGNAASAVSSGGILLKDPGRVGHAACFGCGCWAQSYEQSSDGTCTIAASTSGTGEDLMRVSLAKRCCDAAASAEDQFEAIVGVFKEHFLSSPLLGDVPEKLGGGVVVRRDEDVLELTLAHTTPSFVAGYITGGQKKTKMLVSRCPDEKVGVSVTVQGKLINLRKKRKESVT